MRPDPGTAAAATTPDARSGPAATTSGSASPRLIDGAVRLKDPILDDRSDDLTAIDRSTSERREARELRSARASCRLPPAAATEIPDICPECTCLANLGASGQANTGQWRLESL
jgi:hypothetical protein